MSKALLVLYLVLSLSVTSGSCIYSSYGKTPIDGVSYTKGDEVKNLIYIAKAKGDENLSIWAKNEVSKAYESGYVPKNFGIDYQNPITRREFAKLVVNMTTKVKGQSKAQLWSWVYKYKKGRPTFKDTYDEDVLLAASLGIINGYGDGTFRPQKTLTREEGAVMLTSALNYLTGGSYPITSDIILYSDESFISSWAKGAVQVVSHVEYSKNKVMGGVMNYKFDPKGEYTKEQAICSVYRLGQAVRRDTRK